MKRTSAFLILFAMAAPLLAADAPDRAQQLPPIDAGAILNQINNQHPFPQPNQTTLDTCVMTEFKNNKCYFKCQSGAILTEPAIKPDFSTGEPAAQCASYIIRPVPAPAFKAQTKADLNWKQAKFTAADGTKIVVDYSPLSLGAEIIASPLWVTVVKPGMGFTGAEKVRAVIMNYYDSSNMAANSLFEKQELDLKMVPPDSYGHGPLSYQAQGQRVELSQSHIGYGYNFRQEIAVVVDGQWLTDPVNGTHNFKFKMGW